MPASNMLFMQIGSGETFTIPKGFLFASIYPESGASFTMTNSLEGNGIPNVSTKTSASIDTIYTFPDSPSLQGWAEHVITASGGNVIITYATGR